MARNMHRYEELTPYEFDREKERASIIYVGVGPLEYHEECNILGLDTNKGYDWCLEAAEQTGGIVFPMLPIAPAGHRPHMSRERLREMYKAPRFTDHYTPSLISLYPGMFFSREACYAVYEEMLEMFADELEFKLCVFIGSHSPASQLIKEIIADHNGVEPPSRFTMGAFHGQFHGMHVIASSSKDYCADFLADFNEKNGIPNSLHGGVWEMAMNYAINPDYYHPEYLDETKYPQHFGALLEDYPEDVHRPCKKEFTKFKPEFAYELKKVVVDNLVADVQKTYKEITEEK